MTPRCKAPAHIIGAWSVRDHAAKAQVHAPREVGSSLSRGVHRREAARDKPQKMQT